MLVYAKSLLGRVITRVEYEEQMPWVLHQGGLITALRLYPSYGRNTGGFVSPVISPVEAPLEEDPP